MGNGRYLWYVCVEGLRNIALVCAWWGLGGAGLFVEGLWRCWPVRGGGLELLLMCGSGEGGGAAALGHVIHAPG